MKNASVWCRAGVSRSASSPAAELGGSPPTLAHASRHGSTASSGWLALSAAIWSPFSSGSTEQVT